MDDDRILDMFFDRDEGAITATSEKYGAYCHSISLNILYDKSDAEECVNDTYMRAWEAIPPKRPTVFRVYLGKIIRNLSLDKYKWKNRKKRSADETVKLFSELDEAIPGGASTYEEYENSEINTAINASLRSMTKDARMVFIRRYFFAETVADIAKRFGLTESNVKTTLFRARKKLKADLEMEGVFV